MKIVASIAALAFVAGLSFGCEEKKATVTPPPAAPEAAPKAEEAPKVEVPAVEAPKVEAKVEVK